MASEKEMDPNLCWAIADSIEAGDIKNLRKCFDPEAKVKYRDDTYPQTEIGASLEASINFGVYFDEPDMVLGLSRKIPHFSKEAALEKLKQPKKEENEQPYQPTLTVGSDAFRQIVLRACWAKNEKEQATVVEMARLLIEKGAAPSENHIYALEMVMQNPNQEYEIYGYTIRPGRVDHHLSELKSVMEEGRIIHKKALDDVAVHAAKHLLPTIEKQYSQWRMARTYCQQIVDRAKSDRSLP